VRAQGRPLSDFVNQKIVVVGAGRYLQKIIDFLIFLIPPSPKKEKKESNERTMIFLLLACANPLHYFTFSFFLLAVQGLVSLPWQYRLFQECLGTMKWLQRINVIYLIKM
jgi:hypothetical protein